MYQLYLLFLQQLIRNWRTSTFFFFFITKGCSKGKSRDIRHLTLLDIRFGEQKIVFLAAKRRAATSPLPRSDAARCGFTGKVLCTDRKRKEKKKEKKGNGREVSRKSCAS